MAKKVSSALDGLLKGLSPFGTKQNLTDLINKYKTEEELKSGYTADVKGRQSVGKRTI